MDIKGSHSYTPATIKIRAYLARGRGVLHDCEMLRIPHCLDNRVTGEGEGDAEDPTLPRTSGHR
jgi:hypothetical protein